MVLLACVFLFCGATVAVVQHQYQVNKRLYREAASSFTTQTGTVPSGPSLFQKTDPGELSTVINYPVMHGETNDTYLHHSYDGTYNASGSIFEDARNGRGFVDPVSILYGHHMASGAMFATLDLWQAVDYFYEHPVMWLLTPTRDYKVELCSAYNTSAYSDTYSFFTAHDFAFAEYLRMVLSSSVIRTGAEADPNANYILMSTCAYVFEDARSVLLGKLVPLASAGGKALTQ